MTAVETNPCGITWALSFDHTPFVYNGGYGNSITKSKGRKVHLLLTFKLLLKYLLDNI